MDFIVAFIALVIVLGIVVTVGFVCLYKLAEKNRPHTKK